MTNKTVTISVDRHRNAIVILPMGSVSLSRVESTLVARGMSPTVMRSARKIFLPLQELSNARRALEKWEIQLGPDVLAACEAASIMQGSLLQARRALSDVLKPGQADALLADFPEKKILDSHQVQAVAAATHDNIFGLCLFDEQGLGKTVVGLFSFHLLKERDQIDVMLVIAPKNMILEWVRDLKRFFGNKYTVQAVLGSAREKIRSLAKPSDIYITNFETAISLNFRLRDLLKIHNRRAFLIIDESFYVKNAAARRSKAVRVIRELVERCLVLCGTPAPNSAIDVVEQFNLADGGLAFAGVSIPKDSESARVIIQRTINERGVFLRRLKQEVMLDLKEKSFSKILVPLQPQQEKAYGLALAKLIRALRKTDDITFRKRITSFMAQRQALLQICSNPAAVLERYEEVPAKLLALDSILDELIENRKEKVIVWSFFRASIDGLFRRFHRFNPVRIDGTITNHNERAEAVTSFQSDEQTMLLIANPAAAGAGLTLHRARFAIYESMSNQAAHYLQSLDRIHRRGQTRAVEYLILVADRTIEVIEYDRLLGKERAAQQLLGDKIVASPTRTEMLRDLSDAGALGAFA